MPGLIVGVGLRPGADAATILAAVRAAADGDVDVLATLDLRLLDTEIDSAAALLGAAVIGYPASELDRVPVLERSDRVRAAVGTSSVAEAAALLASGTAALSVSRRVIDGVVVSVATRPAP